MTDNLVEDMFIDADSVIVNNGKVLFETEKMIALSQNISKIVTDRYYTFTNTPLNSLVDVLTKRPLIQAVGVVDNDGNFQGVVIRRQLLNLVSKAYGREVFSRVTMSSYLKMYDQNLISFDMHDSIFGVSDTIGDFLSTSEDSFFVVMNRDRYYGIFTSRDLLVYLAEITRKDFSLSKKIQSRIVKENDMGYTRNFSFSSVSLMALDVGGDFYTVQKVDKDSYFIALCDVSGKGISASLLSSMLYGFTNSYDFSRGLLNFVKDLNSNIFRSFAGEKYITGVFIMFNEKTGILTLIDMGHSHFVVIGEKYHEYADEKYTCFPLGIVKSPEIRIKERVLKRGQKFFLTTDGLIEQADSSGRCYALERAVSVVSGNFHKDVNGITKSIIEDFNTFRKSVVLHDDVTFVIFEYPLTDELHKNRNRIFPDSIYKQIKYSIANEEQFQIKTSRYHPRTRSFVEEVLRMYLQAVRQSHFETVLSYCIHELASNAKRANLKRTFFRDSGLDITNTDDYELGMKTFKKEISRDVEAFLLKQKLDGYFIIISFLLRGDVLRIKIINNAKMLKEEKTRIQEKMRASRQSESIIDTYSKVMDETEGAGFGIVMMGQLLRSIGFDIDNLRVIGEDTKTTAVLSIKIGGRI